MKKLFFFFLFMGGMVAFAPESAAQVKEQFTLSEVITLALKESAVAKQAQANKENSLWRYRTFRAAYKPQLALTGTLPDFNRTISSVTQPDGTTAFRQVAINNSSLTLNISQQMGLTGGQFFVTSQVQRFDDFDRNQKSYNSNPAVIGISQPLFNYNALAWNKRIEPLRFEESEKQYLEDRETIAFNATQYFFDLLLVQVNADIARKNMENNETIYKIAEEKYQMGKISRNDLLQLKLTLLNAKAALAQANLNAKTVSLKLRNYIGFTSLQPIELIMPAATPTFRVDEEMALAEARKNRKETIYFKRQLLEAAQDVAEAKGKNGVNANLVATYGLTNQAANFAESYMQPIDHQRVRLGFEIPILDWGKQKAELKTAQVNQKLTQYTVDQQNTAFEQAATTQINQFQMLREQLQLNAEADAIAQQRYEITQKTYLIGKISITELNIAAGEKDQAKRAYLASLRDFWEAYYNLRTLTLYDFEKNKPLTVEP